MPWNKGRRLPAEPLSSDEIFAMLEATNDGDTGARNRALIVLLWRSGLRINEALSLLPSSIDWDHLAIRIREGKGGKAGTSFFDERTKLYLKEWTTRRPKGVGVPFFCTMDSKPLSRQYVTAMLKRAAKAAGIEKRVSPHQLRHTHAFELALEGVAIPVISKQLRHSSPMITMRYIDHLGAPVVAQAINKREF